MPVVGLVCLLIVWVVGWFIMFLGLCLLVWYIWFLFTYCWA